MRSKKSPKLPLLRFQMTDREAIITRMADDVSGLAHKFGMDRDVTENDLIRLGWEPRQIRAHSQDVKARVYRNRHERVEA